MTGSAVAASVTLRRDALYAQVRAQHATSAALHLRARAALARSREAAAAVEVRGLCRSSHALASGEFRLRGSVAGLPVAAVWADGALSASPRLLEQARVVVALGDVLGDGRPAALAPSRTALLTLARACDRVVQVELGARPRQEPA